jgi:hypothetical protein
MHDRERDRRQARGPEHEQDGDGEAQPLVRISEVSGAVQWVYASTCFPASSRTIVMPAQRGLAPLGAVGTSARAVARQRVTTRSPSANWTSILM